MKFSLWLEKRNERSATKMPERMSNLELSNKAAKKNIHGMQHGRSGSMVPAPKKGSRGEKNRKALGEQY
jgi:hypothetical protein